MELITTDLILSQLREWVETKTPISPHLWIDACLKLNILKGDETQKLYELQQRVANTKVKYIEGGYSVAKAKANVEASDIYKEYKNQEARIEMIEEQIRISKIQARMADSEMKGYN